MAARKPSAKPNVSPEELKQYYHDMLLIRRFEEKAGQLYGMGLIGGFCHLYIGQEAVVVGLEAAASEGDKRVTSYRDHGHMLACGMDPNGVMAELTGREGGYSKGKGGSMHMFSREKHFYGGHGIVGAQVPLGAGLAFADRYLENSGLPYVILKPGPLTDEAPTHGFADSKEDSPSGSITRADVAYALVHVSQHPALENRSVTLLNGERSIGELLG